MTQIIECKAATFEFISTYLGASDYRVRDETGSYRMRHCFEACEYHRSIFYGTAEQFQREVVDAVGTVRRVGDNEQIVPASTIKAFNRRQQVAHEETMRWVDADDQLKRSVGPGHVIRTPPPAVKGVIWNPDTHRWVPTS